MPPGHPPRRSRPGEALAWYDDERANVVAATRQAAAAGLHEVAWRLPPTLFPLFNRWSNWADCVITHRVAAESVRKIGDRLGEAWVLNQLGFALVRLGDTEAFGHLERALAIRQELGDTGARRRPRSRSAREPQDARARRGRAAVHAARGGPARPMGAVSLRGVALNNLGEVYSELGDLDAAAECYLRPRICREIGGYAEGHALHNLGRVYLRQHRLDEAIASCEEALREHRAAGELGGEASTLQCLGQAHAETVTRPRRAASLTAAHAIFEQIGDQAEAAETALLRRLPRNGLPGRSGAADWQRLNNSRHRDTLRCVYRDAVTKIARRTLLAIPVSDCRTE